MGHSFYKSGCLITPCVGFLIPLFSPNAIGMSADDSCWVLGVYVWCYYAFWYCFVILAIFAVIAIYKKLNGYTELSDSVSTSYVKVVTQSALIVFTYFLAWFWCAFFVITFFSQRHWSPYWLFILQVSTLDPHSRFYGLYRFFGWVMLALVMLWFGFQIL